MDPSEATIHKIAECCGQIHACPIDEKKMKALPVETQAFLYINNAYAEKFLQQMKEDPDSNAPLEAVFKALLIHAAALQGKCDELMEKRWFARWRRS
jgi:hypothetical protein